MQMPFSFSFRSVAHASICEIRKLSVPAARIIEKSPAYIKKTDGFSIRLFDTA